MAKKHVKKSTKKAQKKGTKSEGEDGILINEK
jgi:hypothetical protein